MTNDRVWLILWKPTGDVERNLTPADVRRAAKENDCRWEDGFLVDSDGKRVAAVVRTDL